MLAVQAAELLCWSKVAYSCGRCGLCYVLDPGAGDVLDPRARGDVLDPRVVGDVRGVMFYYEQPVRGGLQYVGGAGSRASKHVVEGGILVRSV